MGSKLALCVLWVASLTACGDDLGSLYEDEDYAGTFERQQDDASVLQGATGLWDTAAPQRVPTAAQPRASRRRSLRLFCSPSAKHLIGDPLEGPFERAHPQTDLVLLEEQDRTCIGNVIMQNGTAAIVGVPSSANEHKHGLITKVVGYHIVVVIVHRDNNLTTLFSEPLHRILDGRINNWDQVGWQHLPIQPVQEAPSRRDDAAARLLQMTGKAAQLAVLLPSSDQVIDYVSQEPRALGLVTLAKLGSRRGKVRHIDVHTVPPTVANYLRGAYPFGCAFRLVYTQTTQRDAGLVELLTFLAGNEARQLLKPHLVLP